jgi:MFS family permease
MRTYLRDIARYPRDIRLFFAYQLMANIGFAVFSLIYNLYLIELGLREDYIGEFNGVQTVAMSISGMLIGRVVAKFGTWRAIAFGVGGLLVTSYGLAMSEGPTTLLALSGLFGFALSYMFSLTMPFVLEFAPQSERPRIAAIAFSIQSAATTLGSLLGGFLPDIIRSFSPGDAPVGLTDYRWTLVIGTTLAMTGLIPLAFMGEARRSTRAQDLARAPIEEAPAERRQARNDFVVFVSLAGILALGVGALMPFYNVFLTELGADSKGVGLVFALASGAAAIVGLGAPWVNRRLGTMNAMFLLRFLPVPLFGLLIFYPTFGLAIAAYVVRYMTISMTWPIDSTFTGEILPARMRSTVFGWRSASWNLTFAFASVAGGRIIVSRGYDFTFAAMVIFSLASIALFAFHFRRHPKVRNGEVAHALRPTRPT